MDAEKPKYFEYIVVGCGGIGSATTYWLSKTVGGKDVLGLEQFKLGHDNGGSQDHSRLIRLFHYEDCYKDLVRHTYTAFEEVERESGLQLVYKCGSLELSRAGTPESKVLEKCAQAMERANIPYERLNGVEIHKRFPQFNADSSIVGIYQKDSGLVDAAMANATHIQLARKHGATIVENCKVLKICKDKDGVHALVHTSQGIFRCRRVIVTAGAWTNHVMGSVGVHVPITVTQEQATYLATPHIKDFTKDKFPIYIFHDSKCDEYGFPIHGNTGVKVGIDACYPVISPDTPNSEPDPVKEKTSLNFLKKFIPKAVGPILYTKMCRYALTPDRNFIIDTLKDKGFPQVVLCNGAGHAYKFAGLFGKILTQLAVDGTTQYSIDSFKLDREALTNPNYTPLFRLGGSTSMINSKL